MPLRKTGIPWAIVLAVVTSSGCSTGKLSRREALRLIEDDVSSTRKIDPESSELHATIKGKIGEATRIIPNQYCGDKWYRPTELLEDDGLISSGVVAARELKPCGNWLLTLNPKFKSYVVFPPSLTDLHPFYAMSVELKVGEFDRAEITGITQNGNKACILYRAIWAPNYLGMALLTNGAVAGTGFARDASSSHLVSTGGRSATKFDDGWRLDANGVDRSICRRN